MLKRIALTALAVAGLTVSAQAAPVFNWTGFYVGAQGGYAWGNANVDGVEAHPKGGFGGVTLGYNWQQMNSPWVLGIETDLSFADIKENEIFGIASTKLDYFGTIRGRVGYAWNKSFLYATGGFAYGHNEVTQILAVPPSDSQSHTGFAIGAGIECLWTANWSVKVEFLYIDLGKKSYDIGLGGDVSLDFSTIKVGANYRF